MNTWTLHVKKFGKIESADIEVKPMTLFVGDNNSGKSYLLSLIWYLKNYTTLSAISYNCEKDLGDEIFEPLRESLQKFVFESSEEKKQITINSDIVLSFFNKNLKKHKQNIINDIFNFNELNIEELEISAPKQKIVLQCSVNHMEDIIFFRVKVKNIPYGFRLKVSDKTIINKMMRLVLNCAVMRIMEVHSFGRNYYFPAARTGFVLSRNAINQNSRRNSFDSGLGDLFQINQQFTKPILDFLDMLEMSNNGRYSYQQLVDWIETNLSHGTYSYINEQSRELGFIPKNKNQTLPMRASSAVVTELLPLIILLKNSRGKIDSICYEEPEMCLHPQLQLYMGRCLVRLLNEEIGIIATTHSDIIMQHISNMCVLNKHKQKKDILSFFGYEKSDLLNVDKVAVYQFTEENNETIITRIIEKNNSFDIPTFNNALCDILKITMKVNEE